MLANLKKLVQVLFSLFISISFVNAQNCTCTEVIYLNETTQGGSVHKYTIDPTDGSLTEVLTNGGPWYPGTGVSEMSSPHGLGVDVNGLLYIGEGLGGDVRKLDCKGNITPATEYEIDRGGFNFVSVGNTLYINPNNKTGIEAYDLCTQQLINEVCLTGLASSQDSDWGLSLGPDGNLYASAGYGNNYTGAKIWRISLSDFGSATCIDPLIEADPNGASPTVGDAFLPTNELRGIVVDDNGFIYITERSLTDNSARILKYDSNGQFVAATPFDTIAGDGGYIQAQGLVLSETSGYLYVSTINPTDDCISIIDPATMTYVGVGVPSPGDGTRAKGIAISQECCPTDAIQSISETACLNETSSVFLNEVYECEGVICEGIWENQSIDAGLTYEPCNQSLITANAAGCATFTKVSDGVGGLCGAFNITLEVCFEVCPDCPAIAAPAISITDNTCDPVGAGSVNIDTPCEAGNTIEFSTDGGTTWSATTPTYDNTTAITVRARCVNDADATCLSTETADVASTPEVCGTCLPVNCINNFGEFTITKTRP